MAHFALLDENNVVVDVIVVSNDDTLDEHGNECEHTGSCFCKEVLQLPENAKVVQTSYNSRIRGKYAALGDTYNEEYDIFLPPKPYPSAVFDPEILFWNLPVEKPENPPEGFLYYWDEESVNWKLHDLRSPFKEITNDKFRSKLTLEEKLLWDNPETGTEVQKTYITTLKLEFPTILYRDKNNEIFDLLVSKEIFTQERIDEITKELLLPEPPQLPPELQLND